MKRHRTFDFDPVPPSAGAVSTRVLAVLTMLSVGCTTTDPSRLQVEQSASQVSVFTTSGQQVLVYHLRPPPGTKLAVESGDFFHPLTTPHGVVVTDLAPTDHPHHRGVFLGRDVRMINPCIAAPAEVKLTKGKPLTLRYRVVAADGDVPTELLNRLAKEWSAD